MDDNKIMIVLTADDEEELDIEASYEEGMLGHAWTIRDNGRMHICEIRIYPGVQRRGIGSKMLQYLIDRAKRDGIREVWGSVVQDDIDGTPGLLGWYEKHGFTVTDPDEDCYDVPAAKKVTLVV